MIRSKPRFGQGSEKQLRRYFAEPRKPKLQIELFPV
jgi:hypothetical protein